MPKQKNKTEEEQKQENLDAIEYLRTAQAHTARTVQAKLKDLGIEAFPSKMKIDDKLQIGVSIPHGSMSALEEVLTELITPLTSVIQIHSPHGGWIFSIDRATSG